MSNLDTLAAALFANVQTLVAEARKAEAKAANLPEVEADVAALLDALAVAEMEARHHFKKFPRTDAWEGAYNNDPEVEADWKAVCAAREKAIGAITRFAMARFEAASVAKAA